MNTDVLQYRSLRGKAVLLLTLLSALVAPAYAAVVTGNELHEFCKPESARFDTGFCRGYIAGVWETLPKCTPNGVTLGQLTDVVRKHLRERPEQRHAKAEALVRDALSIAYNCNDDEWVEMEIRRLGR